MADNHPDRTPPTDEDPTRGTREALHAERHLAVAEAAIIQALRDLEDHLWVRMVL